MSDLKQKTPQNPIQIARKRGRRRDSVTPHPGENTVGAHSLKVAVWAGLFVTIVDIAYAVFQGLAPLEAFAPLAVGLAFSSTICWLVTLALVGLVQLTPFSVVSKILNKTTLRTRILLLVGLVGSVGLHVFNTHYYARLYLSLHIALSLAQILLVSVTLFFAMAVPKKGTQEERYLAAPLVWAVLAVGSVGVMLVLPALRHASMNRTTLTSHWLLSLEAMTGIFTEDISPERAEAERKADDLTPTRRELGHGSHRGKNLIILTIDSLRHDRTLPVFHEFKKSSVRFTHAYAPACATIQSMTATMTSRLPHQLKFTPTTVVPGYKMVERDARTLIDNPIRNKQITPTPLKENAPTLAGLLTKAGYQTYTTFQYVFYLRAAGITRGFEIVDEEPFRTGSLDGMGLVEFSLTERTLAHLDKRDTSRPFFVWLHFMDLHAPYKAYNGVAPGAPAIERYDSGINRVSDKVQQLFDGLRKRNLLDSTIVVLHADHGEEFREHGGTFHGTTVYEEVIRVPLLLRAPGIVGPTEEHTAVSALNLTPTLLDMLGIETDVPFTGHSMAERLRGGPMKAAPVASECIRFGRHRKARIEWPMKLILDRSTGSIELYNLFKDPAEQNNLAN